jgi:hypothetical protein
MRKQKRSEAGEPLRFDWWDDLRKVSYFREQKAIASTGLAGGSEMSEG